MRSKCDVAVIGGGVIGCMVARELSRYCLDVLVLERAEDVGEGSSKANSGLIHTGFHARGGSLKGLSTVEGNRLYSTLVEELEVPYERVGGLYCAFGPNGLERMHEKHDRALENGAGDLPILSGDEARTLEPRLSQNVIAAMWAETTGIISPFALVTACAENAAENGVEFRFHATVEHIEHRGGCWVLHLADGSRVRARYVVNAAGDQAALLDTQVRPADLVVEPRLGQFYVFDKQGVASTAGAVPEPIRHVLFQSAENDEGGTLVAPTIDGNIIAGPTSDDVRFFYENATTAEGLEHVRAVAQKLVPDLQLGRVITQFAGIRANITNVEKEKKDFVVRASAPGFVSLLGIKNPGMTCAPALARRVVRTLEDEGLFLEPDLGFDSTRRRRVPFLRCTPQEQEKLLREDPGFGHVLCRCEKITEGDVRRELTGVLPPVSFEGLKHRLRCGMGRCQGGFCRPRAISVLERELEMAQTPDLSPVSTQASDESGLPAVLERLASVHLEQETYDVLVIGGGAAGLAAAAASARSGARTLLVEREAYLGGVLPQCIHDGFGMYVYKENLTGPQYALRWLDELAQSGVDWACETSVTSLADAGDGRIEAQLVGTALGGARVMRFGSVVFAGGCREVTRGQLRIPGTRPEGIYTAGTAQYMMNIEHKLPGHRVVVLGGGDIGLIMARRLTLSGAEVRMVVAKEATGLMRNHRRCIDPFGIETRYGWGVCEICGYGQLEGVRVAPFADDGSLCLDDAEFVECDTLLLAAGLVPERELVAPVEGHPSLLVCGNAESVHDLVDRVSVEALSVGVHAAELALGEQGVVALPERLQELSQVHVRVLPVGERRERS